MIDYFFKFNTEADAIADASGTIYYTPSRVVQGVTIPGAWNGDRVIPNLQVWRASQDVSDGGSPPIIAHNYLSGWYGIISIMEVKPVLLNHSALQIALDREIAARTVGDSPRPTAILRNNLGPVVLQDLRFAPVFMGSNYPFGNIV